MAKKPNPKPQAEAAFLPYSPAAMLEKFLKMEAAGGLILLFFAALALIVANSPLGHTYHHFLHETYLTIKMGDFGLNKHIIHWINDGLMAIFFLLVGLEIKREMLEGNLSSVSQATLPAIAAVGGMAIPALTFFYFNGANPEALAGWATPTATDIAFAVGLMSLLGTRVPLSLKVFLLALAIFDDLGAIMIIAVFYSHGLDTTNLMYAAGFLSALIFLNRMGSSKGSLYMVLGIAMWFCVLKSGVHATLAGVALALTIPLNIEGERRSLLRQLEHDLHALVAYFILPLFAFANAGVDLHGLSFAILFEPITLGVILGLFVGKQVGIFGFVWLAVKIGLAKLPEKVTWPQIWGVSCMAGIGFTMSLFIAGLAYKNPLYLAEAKLGILAGSFLSAVTGIALLYIFGNKPTVKKK